jgi:hypothetical protein
MLGRIAFILLLAALPAISQAQTCGDIHGRAGTDTITMTLLPRPDSPSFYFRSEGFVVFITPDVILESLHSLPSSGIADKLEPLIRDRLPLKENQDFFQFELGDSLFWAITNLIVIRSIENGKASISNEGAVWSKQVTIVHDRRPSITTTDIFDGIKGRNRIIGQADCIAD